VWCVNLRLGVHTDYAHLASLEVYVPTTPGCIYCIFVSYPGWSSLFCHERKSTHRTGPRHCYKPGRELRRTLLKRTSMRRHILSRPTWRPPFVVEPNGSVSFAMLPFALSGSPLSLVTRCIMRSIFSDY
jgi:hypothetical protein